MKNVFFEIKMNRRNRWWMKGLRAVVQLPGPSSSPVIRTGLHHSLCTTYIRSIRPYQLSLLLKTCLLCCFGTDFSLPRVRPQHLCSHSIFAYLEKKKIK